MRCHGGPRGDQRNISYEFVLSGDPISSALDFEWYQEFFNDHPWVNLGASLPDGFRQVFTPATPARAYPDARVFPGSAENYPWAREQVAIAGAAGAIDHYNVTRAIASMSVPMASGADIRYFPMLVHTMWVRIAIRTTTATPAGGYPHFRIYGHAGGLTEIEAYSERISTIFDWAVPAAE
jgi:hypothetical protein